MHYWWLLYGKAILFKFYGDYSKCFGCPNFQEIFGSSREKCDFHLKALQIRSIIYKKDKEIPV